MYIEGEVPNLVTSNGNNNGWNDWSWIIGLAVIGAVFGGNGFGFSGGNRGNCATQADLAAGFNNSAVLANLNDIILGQAQMQNFINQGFAGLQNSLTSGFAGVNNAICTLGYNQASLINGLSSQLAQCCCDTRAAIADVKYSNERNTCDIIRAGQDNTRAILDFLTNEKISSLQAENSGLKAQISNDRQSRFIIEALSPKCPQPAYVVQPPQEVTFPTNCCGNVAYANYNNNSGCGCY